MTVPPVLRTVSLALAVMLGAAQAQADSVASSASSAGSASSGSVSDSFKGSSNSSSGQDRRADGDYKIIELAAAPDRPGIARITMVAEDPTQRFVLDLPQKIVDQQRLGRGDVVHAQQREYGYEFARGDTRAAFFLVLADDWYGELAAHPVPL